MYYIIMECNIRHKSLKICPKTFKRFECTHYLKSQPIY